MMFENKATDFSVKALNELMKQIIDNADKRISLQPFIEIVPYEKEITNERNG